MKHATRLAVVAALTGKGVARGAQVGMVAIGLLAVVHVGKDHLRHDPFALTETGLFDAQRPLALPVADGGDRWKVAPSAMLAAAEDVSLGREARPPVRRVPAETGDRWKVAPSAMRAAAEDVPLGREVVPSARVTVAKAENVSLGRGLKPSVGAAGLRLSDEMTRVRDWVSQRYGVPGDTLEPVLATAEVSAREAGLDPLLLVAMMAVESSFNPLAESRAGAQGLMQVIPRWHMDKIGEDAPEDALFDPVFNVQVGTQVLVEGLQRYGSLQAALQYYGGARNDPEARYTKRVMSMKARLASAARTVDAGA